jgi:hypothetical protein
MSIEKDSILERFAVEAIRLGADEMEIEYEDGQEMIFAVKNGLGFGIGRLPSSESESNALRAELRTLTRRKRAIVVDDVRVELRATAFDSFGEIAYRVKLKSV